MKSKRLFLRSLILKDKKKKGIGLTYAFNGLKEAFKRERNFRIHLYVTIVVIFFCLYFQLTAMEWVIILMMIHIVLIAELVNSLMERMIDYMKPEYHPQAKIIKDISAAVVLIAAITSIIIGTIIFFPKVFL